VEIEMQSHCWLCDYTYDYGITKEKERHDLNHKRMARQLFLAFKDVVDHQRRRQPIYRQHLSGSERKLYQALVDLGLIEGNRAIID
jgi:hypothetical protein